eukprot:641171-Rhodomonas_salina.1
MQYHISGTSIPSLSTAHAVPHIGYHTLSQYHIWGTSIPSLSTRSVAAYALASRGHGVGSA